MTLPSVGTSWLASRIVSGPIRSCRVSSSFFMRSSSKDPHAVGARWRVVPQLTPIARSRRPPHLHVDRWCRRPSRRAPASPPSRQARPRSIAGCGFEGCDRHLLGEKAVQAHVRPSLSSPPRAFPVATAIKRIVVAISGQRRARPERTGSTAPRHVPSASAVGVCTRHDEGGMIEPPVRSNAHGSAGTGRRCAHSDLGAVGASADRRQRPPPSTQDMRRLSTSVPSTSKTTTRSSKSPRTGSAGRSRAQPNLPGALMWSGSGASP